MSLFLGPMRQHIPGKKELTEKSELLHLMPKKEVYIPLVAGRTLDFDILVEEGDTVSIIRWCGQKTKPQKGSGENGNIETE